MAYWRAQADRQEHPAQCAAGHFADAIAALQLRAAQLRQEAAEVAISDLDQYSRAGDRWRGLRERADVVEDAITWLRDEVGPKPEPTPPHDSAECFGCPICNAGGTTAEDTGPKASA